MEVRAEVSLPCDAPRARDVLADLSGYPKWLGIVHAASTAAPTPDDPRPAWLVDIGARVGPIRRTKRLRMIRALDTADHLRFERCELDGVPHSPWDLDITLRSGSASPPATFTSVVLHYGGTAWLPLLDAVLAAEVRRALPRLVAIVSA